MNTPMRAVADGRIWETLGTKAVESRLENLMDNKRRRRDRATRTFIDELEARVEQEGLGICARELQLAPFFPFVKTSSSSISVFRPIVDDRRSGEWRSLRFIHEAAT